MSYVTTVCYSVNFNQVLLDSFQLTRGLRQGDPISPYLFLFVANCLTLLLKNEVDQGAIIPLKMLRRAPVVSHLLFADHTLLFFKARRAQARKVMQVLQTFCASTGQLVNPKKCSILFGEHCPDSIISETREEL